jgi:hypothetical protein
MKKLSKADMKKMKGGDLLPFGCGGACFYFSGGLFKTSFCRPQFPLAPLVAVLNCVCQATGRVCGTTAVITV